MTSWRSITSTLVNSSQFLCWPGVISLSKIITSHLKSFTCSSISWHFPFPRICPGYVFRVLTMDCATTEIERFSTNSDSSPNNEAAVPSSSFRVITETKKARSTFLGFSLTSNMQNVNAVYLNKKGPSICSIPLQKIYSKEIN